MIRSTFTVRIMRGLPDTMVVLDDRSLFARIPGSMLRQYMCGSPPGLTH
jgi:hypothetical protein